MKYFIDTHDKTKGSFPKQELTEEQFYAQFAALEEPADAARWNGPYVKRRDALMDPWGRMYVDRFPGQNGAYDLYSLGADGGEGGDGEDQDVSSW